MSKSSSEHYPIPKQVGPYRIKSRLGVGGMGAVYKAYDDRLKRTVAIKHILPHIAGDESSRHRLRREAQAAASLSHPSIVQIFDIFEAHGFDWIVMEFVDGDRLQVLIEDNRVGLAEAVGLSREIAEGLAEAHSKGIVHRDLKTENVMVTRAFHAKILDFGLAKNMFGNSGKLSSDSEEITDLGAILGTGRAMSPEQAMGEEVDHRSDLFSLGTLMFETVTGRSPFAGNSVYNTLAKVCSARQTPAREVNRHVPVELSNLIDRLLEKNPEHRPQSAREVIVELRVIEKLPLPEWGGVYGPHGDETAEPSVDFLDLDPAQLPPPDRPPMASRLSELAAFGKTSFGRTSFSKATFGKTTASRSLAGSDDAPSSDPNLAPTLPPGGALRLPARSQRRGDDTPPLTELPPLSTSQELTEIIGRSPRSKISANSATAEMPVYAPVKLSMDTDSATSVTTRPQSGIYLRAVLAIQLEKADGQPPNKRIQTLFHRKLRYFSLEYEGQQAEADQLSLLLFERPSLAHQCALACLHWAEELPDEPAVHIRAGLHMGELVLAHQGLQLQVAGRTLEVACDLLDIAQQGQVLVTPAIYHLTQRALGESSSSDSDGSWVEHGPYYVHRLRETLEVRTLAIREDLGRREPAESTGIRRLAAGAVETDSESVDTRQ